MFSTRTMICAVIIAVTLMMRRAAEDYIRSGKRRTLREYIDIMFPQESKAGFAEWKKSLQGRKKHDKAK